MSFWVILFKNYRLVVFSLYHSVNKWRINALQHGGFFFGTVTAAQSVKVLLCPYGNGASQIS